MAGAVEVELYGLPRLYAGAERCSVPAGSLRTVLQAVAAALPGLREAGIIDAEGRLSEHVVVAVGGRVIGALEGEVAAGEVVVMVSAQAGG